MTNAATTQNRYTLIIENDIHIIEDSDGQLVRAFTNGWMALNEFSYLEQGWYYDAVDGELTKDY